MSNVTSLREPDKETIAVLEELLEKARTGELQSIMFIDKYWNGICGNGWMGRPDDSMIGGLEDLKFNYLSQKYFPVDDQ